MATPPGGDPDRDNQQNHREFAGTGPAADPPTPAAGTGRHPGHATGAAAVA